MGQVALLLFSCLGSERMKVLHFLDTTNRGGAEIQVLDICRNAGCFGLQMTFVTAQGGALEEDFQQSGAEFFRFNRRFPLDLGLIFDLRKIIREKEIDIVQGYQAVEGLHLYLATKNLPKVKKVLSFQGGTIYDWKNHWTLRFLIPRMDANIVVSQSLKKLHSEIDGFDTSNFSVIHNGADPYRLQPTGSDLRKELKLSGEHLLIGMVGNFYREPRKDQMTLCRALPEVFREMPNVHCVFVGKVEHGAEDKKSACESFCRENGIADRVHFLGARSDISDILNALDVFVLSSLREGLPVAVSEAMLARLPLILSDIEPLLEVSDGGKYAEIFAVGDATELSNKLLKLLKSRELRESLATRSFQFAKENFSIEAHLKALKQLYKKILEQ
jgi:glycosyltransferase involved in cell wall biosynthesis